jgi:WD40 repeat protein
MYFRTYKFSFVIFIPAIISAFLLISLAVESQTDTESIKESGDRVKSFVVWESNRTGEWELYSINTDGSGFRKLTNLAKTYKIPYDKYLRPRVSPDGENILFAYGKQRGAIEVWTVTTEGGKARRLTSGNPLCWSPDGEMIFFVRNHQVWQYQWERGMESLLYKVRVPDSGSNGIMVGDIRLGLKEAVFRTNQIEYFSFEKGDTVKTIYGCEPRFTRDGRYLYWLQGAKKFRVWDIDSDIEFQFFGEPPVERWNYTYFPTVSADKRWLVYAASPDQHDHNTSDYEIFLQELDDWKPKGVPIRLSWDEHTDRWPFLWLPKIPR